METVVHYSLVLPFLPLLRSHHYRTSVSHPSTSLYFLQPVTIVSQAKSHSCMGSACAWAVHGHGHVHAHVHAHVHVHVHVRTHAHVHVRVHVRVHVQDGTAHETSSAP